MDIDHSAVMMARSHMPFAMATWWLVAAAIGHPITGYSSLAASLGGLLPDIDHPESVVGRRVRLISVPLSAIFGHRGFTHSLLAVALIGLLVTQVPLYGQSWWVPICVGYLSHILGDALSASGVPLLYPVSKRRFKMRLLPVNSWQETAVVGIFFFLTLGFSGAGEEIIQHAFSEMRADHLSFQ